MNFIRFRQKWHSAFTTEMYLFRPLGPAFRTVRHVGLNTLSITTLGFSRAAQRDDGHSGHGKEEYDALML